MIVHKFTMHIDTDSNITKEREKQNNMLSGKVDIGTAGYGDDCSRVRGRSNVTTPH